ncbi:sensor histidine kinase [Labedella endophytica]|uniref:histidine kinase n=2 Tax=Labedella endophytica TaxID=1523160 RepID=A0A433JXH0_9MICO|nr:sensor histidine kinase [Labedella endophytica]
MIVFVWATALLERGDGLEAALTVFIGGLVWVGATVPLLLDYRNTAELTAASRRRRAIAPIAASAAYGVVALLVSGVWTFAAVPLIAAIVLLTWPPGVRRRITVGSIVVIAALWFIDTRSTLRAEDVSSLYIIGFFSIMLPLMSVISVWWWDVLDMMNRARASEGRLAATQERLRVATDVHDLQGHHLQVIALQLELAERLLAADPAAALEQVQAARVSVAEARQGTRDLATRFRSAPLSVELANAVDLLRAAGTVAERTADPDVDSAPGDVFGPVIRETTTNVLRHGGGAWARLSLTRTGGAWRFEIANDAGAERPADAGTGGGSGLEGIARRAADAGGTLEVRPEKQSFTVIVTVPITTEDAR